MTKMRSGEALSCGTWGKHGHSAELGTQRDLDERLELR